MPLNSKKLCGHEYVTENVQSVLPRIASYFTNNGM